MHGSTRDEMIAALESIASMIERSVAAQQKFTQGTSQYSLQENRIKALEICAFLIEQVLSGDAEENHYTKGELEKAHAPIASLIRKSEKAQRNLREGTWQHTMLKDNVKALHIAMHLLEKLTTI